MMLSAAQRQQHRGDAGQVLVTVAAQVLLVCAALLACFSYFQLPLFMASGAALAILLAGSLLCWRSFLAARLTILVSLVAIEAAVLGFEPEFLAPSVAIDIAAAILLLRMGRRN